MSLPSRKCTGDVPTPAKSVTPDSIWILCSDEWFECCVRVVVTLFCLTWMMLEMNDWIEKCRATQFRTTLWKFNDKESVCGAKVEVERNMTPRGWEAQDARRIFTRLLFTNTIRSYGLLYADWKIKNLTKFKSILCFSNNKPICKKALRAQMNSFKLYLCLGKPRKKLGSALLLYCYMAGSRDIPGS